jgi:hypothetical protein
VQEDDTCGLLSEEFSISLQNFYFLNPEINANCTNLDLGIAYCVEPVGNVATYSGYSFTTASAAYTVPLATFSSVNTAIPSATGNPGYTATTSLLPTASGTLNGCNTYRNYDNSTNGVNGCSAIASAYDVTISQLLSWNPSLPSNQTICYFLSGFSYCVLQSSLTSCKFTSGVELVVYTNKNSEWDQQLFANQCHYVRDGTKLQLFHTSLWIPKY